MLSRKRVWLPRRTLTQVFDLISPSSSWLWELLEGDSPQARQLSADSIAMSHGDVMRCHPVSPLRGRTFVRVRVGLKPLQPPIRIKAVRISVRDPLPLAPCGAPESPRAQPAVSSQLEIYRLRATPKGAITSWLTTDARINHKVKWAGTGPSRHVGFTSTSPGSCPGPNLHANNLSGSKSTWSRITWYDARASLWASARMAMMPLVFALFRWKYFCASG